MDRPGVGISTAHGGRSYTDYAKDVEELIAQLNLNTATTDAGGGGGGGRGVAVVGYSSGGPHTLSCAAHMDSDVVKAVGLIATDGPYVLMGDMEMYTNYFGDDAAKASPVGLTLVQSVSHFLNFQTPKGHNPTCPFF